jgi:2-succinyl-5-enolpyruvyl-6-hydroxy-3-cyclohexene-1-carboxylate synthase
MGNVDFFYKLSQRQDCKDHEFYYNWKYGEKQTNQNSIELPLSNMFAAQSLHDKIPANSYINFAILNSLRIWSYIQFSHPVKAFSNVAAFGIDGCMSTAFGESVGTDELCFHITGDLAFFYDMNILGNRGIGNNLRILVINNHRGEEFRLNPVLEEPLGDKIDKLIIDCYHYKIFREKASSKYKKSFKDDFEQDYPTYVTVNMIVS